MTPAERNREIIRTGTVGIAANLMLATFKAFVGALSGSIAITLDAVNNLSDALSSVITIVAAKLSAKPADREHPLGYGRVEYLSAMLISGIVLFAGATSLIESAKKVMEPTDASYSPVALLIIAVAIAAKLLLGTYTRRKGRETQSDSLVASGSDALFDAVVSLTTLISAGITILWGINLDGWLGAVIAVVILRAGFGMLRETLDDILGKRIDAETAGRIRAEICTFDGVLGAYDLFLDSYGPQKLAGSVHIEVCDTMTAGQIDILTRSISRKVYRMFGVILTCGIYAVDTVNEKNVALRREITDCVKRHAGVLQVHGFHVDEEEKVIGLDVVRDFSVRDVATFLQEIDEELTALHPEYRYAITPDLNISDIRE